MKNQKENSPTLSHFAAGFRVTGQTGITAVPSPVKTVVATPTIQEVSMPILTDVRSGAATPAVACHRIQRELPCELVAPGGTLKKAALRAETVPAEPNLNRAERIVGGLVNDYFRCSTTKSGIFMCW